MGGAMNVFGQFLDGYMKGRNQKQALKQQQDSALIDEAMSWAKVADTTQNDSIREMATRNMQDRMVKHEKSQGEKNGIGAIIKLFRHDKKDSPSLINALSKQAANPPQLLSAPGGPDKLDQREGLSKTMEAASNEQGQAPVGSTLGYQTEESVNPPDAKSFSDIAGVPESQATPQDSSQALVAQGAEWQKPMPKDYAASADRAQNTLSQVAPDKTMFLPRYGGGTRFSPTNEEKADFDLKMKERENKVASDAAFENQKRLLTWQKEQKDIEDKKSLDQLRSTQLYVNATPEMREQMEYQTVTKNQPPQLPADWGKPTTDFTYEGDKVYATNAYGKRIDATLQWREKNPYAAMDFDSQPAGQRSHEKSMKVAADVQKSVQDVERRLKTSQAMENEARGSYYRQLPQIEREKIKETKDRIKGSNQAQARIRMSELDEKMWPAEARKLVPDIGMGQAPTDQQLEAAITGKENGAQALDENGQPRKPIRNPNTGKPFTSLQEYKNWFYSNQLGGADPNSVRYFSVTGVNPWKDLDTEDETGLGTKDAGAQPATPGKTPGKDTGKVDNSAAAETRKKLGL